MADKKRAPVKAKKPSVKKAPKVAEELETKTPIQEEEEMDSNIQMDTNEATDSQNQTQSQSQSQEFKNVGRPPERAQQDEEREEDRQPNFNGPRNDGGVRAQDVRPSDEYTIETYFDKTLKLFVATVVEYPELRCTGHTRDEAQVDLEERLEDYVYDLKARGGQIVEAVHSRQYPEKMELPLSQSLYRKLEQLSRHEKLPLDRLVAELLSAAVEKRSAQSRPQQPQQNHGREQHNRDDRDNRGQHQGGGHHGQNRHQGGGHHRHQGGGGGNRPQRGGGGGGGGSNYRALDSRENFMEYVRNLEKTGGPGWKKR